MPRYFFSTEGDGSIPDEEGTVLPGPKEARDAAATLAGELLTGADGRFWGSPEWRLLVTDEGGATVCTLTIKGTTGEEAG